MTVNELLHELQSFVDRGYGDMMIAVLHKYGVGAVEPKHISGPYKLIKPSRNRNVPFPKEVWYQLGEDPSFGDDEEKEKEFKANNTIIWGFLLYPDE